MLPTSDSQISNVAKSFDRSVESYQQHAGLQRRTAAALATVTAEHRPVTTVRRWLEIGCGTGFLTEKLFGSYPNAESVITDLSPSMVDFCRQKMQPFVRSQNVDRCAEFRVMDGNSITADGPFDLICSNLVFQWFPDLLHVVTNCVQRLAPGGALIFNTLGSKSFRYWQELDRLLDGEPTAPVFPVSEELAEELRVGCADSLERKVNIHMMAQEFVDQHVDFLDFLQHLKTIGAGTPIGGRSVNVGRLRELIRQSRDCSAEEKSQGLSLNYEVITFVVQRVDGLCSGDA